jgi:hypothetical protein
VELVWMELFFLQKMLFRWLDIGAAIVAFEFIKGFYKMEGA